MVKIEEEIKQSKFRNEHHKLFVNVLYTGSWLANHSKNLLKPYGITPEQFNVLRILRGQAGQPASVALIQERMIERMSNASRLVEKLRQKKMVERKVCNSDRRQVDVFITKQGLAVLQKIDDREDSFEQAVSKLSNDDAKILNNLLDRIRD